MSKENKYIFQSKKINANCLLGALVMIFVGISSCGTFKLPPCDLVKTVYLKNRTIDNAYIKIENQKLSTGSMNGRDQNGIWELDCFDYIYFTIKKQGTKGTISQFLHAKSGFLQCSAVPETDWAAHWKKTKVKGTTNYRIENRLYKGQFLSLEENEIVIDTIPASEAKSHWEFVEPSVITDLYQDWEEMTKNIMGKGYRGAGSYADMKQTTESLFDLDHLVKNTIKTIIPKYEGKRVEGRSIREYVSDLSASIELGGSSGLFSGSARAGFSTSIIQNTDNYFYTVLGVIQHYRLDVDYTSIPLRAKVREDIASMPVKTLIDKYGTHFIKSAFIGGRISFNTYIDHTKFDNKNAFDASVEAAYGTVSGKVNISGVNKKETETFYKQANVLVFGGSPLEASKLRQDKDVIAYENWSSTLKENMTLADFGINGLVPISVLAETKERKNEIGNYIKKHLAEQGGKLPKEPVSILKNSTVMIQHKDNRFITRPIFHPWPNEFYYPKLKNETYNIEDNFRVAGLFTFNKSSSDILKSHDNVSIIFDEKKLYRDWNIGIPKEEKNPVFLKRKYLQPHGFTVNNAHYYLQNNEWTRWVIEKVGGVAGEPIYSGDEVYIYSPAREEKEFLYPHPNTEIFVEQMDVSRKDMSKFIWKIILDDDMMRK